jgi:hypothetical protein
VIAVIIDGVTDSHYFPFKIIGYPHFLITSPVLFTINVIDAITDAAMIGCTVICVFIFLTMLSLFF